MWGGVVGEVVQRIWVLVTQMRATERTPDSERSTERCMTHAVNVLHGAFFTGETMKKVTLTDEQWAMFYGALLGLKMNPDKLTGRMFFALSPLVEQAVEAVQNAEDKDE